MTTKNQIFTSVISGSPMITSEKLVGSENYLSWSASVELWFMGQGYEDHLVTQEADIPEAKGLYTNDIQRLYKVASAIVHLSQQDLDLSTYIGQIASLKEQFLTVMPLTPDVGAQQTQLDNSSVPSLDDVFARLLRISSTQTLPQIALQILLFTWKTSSHCHMAQSSDSPLPQPPSSSASQTSQASIASVAQPGLFSSITTTTDLPTVTLANGSQTVAKGPEYGEDDCIGRESQGLYHLTSDSSPALGKHTRVSFPKRLNNRAKSPFELVHTDVWGPCRTASTLGFQYFVTFIDDYSRCLSSSPSCRCSSLFPEAPADSLPIPSASPAPALPSPNDLPIAVRKGWRQAMVDEMAALHSNGTWDLVVLPSGKSTVGCRWVYAVKVGPDGQVDRLKARLVAKGYTQVYGSDYGDTFSPVAKIASVRLLLSMAAMCSWPLYQLDIKNAFLHGDLAEEVYMEQPPGFVAQGESGLVCRLRRSLYGLKQSPRAWFSRFSSVVQEFGMLRNQRLGETQVFLGIEIAQSSSGVVLFPKKYALDILEETGMLDCKPVDTPMDPNVKLVPGQGEPLGDPGRYRRLVGKLNYLTITRPDISFPVSVVSQFLQSPCDSHWDAVIRILRYIKSTPGQGVLYQNRGHTQVVGYTDADWAGSPTDRRSTSGYCVFIGGNLISWKSKKQDVVARSSAEAEYRAMALATCELIWLRHLLQELRFGKDEQMKLICDNQAALHIASNPVFHERTKHN
ncbi:Retrovirus-related Pol polyprotein from transposon RE2 [Vitis vinifera]|uniref:Retrovirus-related Pol polyprotein from transposon RE2 n=1 Tax=Vitis vinifera TaxID=29760 RepID=A0A438KAA0_VITVI|nr:Retrovirus-related Pol polyprotein from transposon RE2 [Vitis vinifera]